MGTVQLFNADCLAVLPTLAAGSVDAVIADLPYGTTGCTWDVVIPFSELWPEYERVTKPDAAIVLFANEPFTSLMVMSRVDLFRYKWTWNKLIGSNFQLANLRPMNVTEDICVFSKAKSANGADFNCRYYPQMTRRREPIKSGGRSQSPVLNPHNMVAMHKTYWEKHPMSLLEYEKPSNDERVHPTQKPLALLEYLVRTYTLENQTVLDNVMGSGTTGVACAKLGRNFIGVEIDEGYFNIAKRRIEQAQAQLRLEI